MGAYEMTDCAILRGKKKLEGENPTSNPILTLGGKITC